MQKTLLQKLTDRLDLVTPGMPALIEGVGVRIITCYNLYCHTENPIYLEAVQTGAEELLNSLDEVPDGSFGYGKAGILYLLLFLRRQEMIDFDLAVLTFYENEITDACQAYVVSHIYDLQSGYIGIGLYYLEAYLSGEKQFAKKLDVLVEDIEQAAVHTKGGICWRYYLQGENGRSVNIGLLHGVCSLLSFLSLIYPYVSLKENICILLAEGFCFIESLKKEGIYPYGYDFANKDRLQTSRHNYSYCLGETGIYSTYLLINSILRNSRIEEAVKQLATVYMQQTVNLGNPYFCHGMSGVLYLYNRICETDEKWTNNRKKDTCLNLLSQMRIEKGIPHLLSGIDGIILTLLMCNKGNYETGWERMLLLR